MFTMIKEAQMAASILTSVLASTLDDTDIGTLYGTLDGGDTGEAMLWQVVGRDPADPGKEVRYEVLIVTGIGGWPVRVTRGEGIGYDILYRVNSLSDLPGVVASILGVG